MSGGFGYWIADLPRVIFRLATFGNRLPEIRGPPSRLVNTQLGQRRSPLAQAKPSSSS